MRFFLCFLLFAFGHCVPIKSEIQWSPRNSRLTNPSDFVYAPSSTRESVVKLLTGQYETNIVTLKSWLPDGWKLTMVCKWNSYGHGIKQLGHISAHHGHVGVYTVEEALAVYKFLPAGHYVMRIRPAGFEEMMTAVKSGVRMLEFIGTHKAASDAVAISVKTQTKMTVQLYIGDHYGDPWGFKAKTSFQLQRIVDNLKDYLDIRGFFMHLGFDKPADETDAQILEFLNMVCPVALTLASEVAADAPPILVHWAASNELFRKFNKETGKINVEIPQGCRNHPKIQFTVRIGSSTYGMDAPHIAVTNFVIQPIINWTSKLKLVTDKIAVVGVGISNGYYSLSSGRQFVVINGHKYYLYEPAGKNELKIDVSSGPIVKVGDEVTLLGTSPALVYLDATRDQYNVIICIVRSSHSMVIGTDKDTDDGEPCP